MDWDCSQHPAFLRAHSDDSVSVRSVPAMVKRDTILVRLVLTRAETRTTREFLHHGLGTGTTCKVSITAHRCEIGRPCGEIMVRNWTERCCTNAGMARARVER